MSLIAIIVQIVMSKLYFLYLTHYLIFRNEEVNSKNHPMRVSIGKRPKKSPIKKSKNLFSKFKNKHKLILFRNITKKQLPAHL